MLKMLVRPIWNRSSLALALALVLAIALFTATTGAGAAPKSKHVKFYTPSRNIYCGIYDDGGSQSSVFCEMLKPPALASVFANGRLTIRRGAREVGNPGEGDLARSAHLLRYGSSATAGRFRCKSALAGVTCVVIKTGRGFFISKQSVRAVGPPPSPTTAEFNSVPGWYCSMFSAGVSCEDVVRGWTADLSQSGAVAICTTSGDTCHTGTHILKAPTLKVGQRVTIQPFRCAYAASGLKCTVIKTGVGFLLTPSGATKVG